MEVRRAIFSSSFSHEEWRLVRPILKNMKRREERMLHNWSSRSANQYLSAYSKSCVFVVMRRPETFSSCLQWNVGVALIMSLEPPLSSSSVGCLGEMLVGDYRSVLGMHSKPSHSALPLWFSWNLVDRSLLLHADFVQNETVFLGLFRFCYHSWDPEVCTECRNPFHRSQGYFLLREESSRRCKNPSVQKLHRWLVLAKLFC